MIHNLLPLIPPHKIYVEPFCGGSSLFFAKKRPKVTNDHDYREVLNDTNHELVNMYRVAKLRKDEFLEQLNAIPYSEYWHNKFKQNDVEQNELTLAVGFYIRIMMSFTNILDSGFAFSKYTANLAATYFNHLEKLSKIIDRLKGVFIFDRDALDIIEKFDYPEAFFYCDPPYPGTNQGHYGGYVQEDIEKLIEVLKNCEGSFMISCYQNEAVPKEWERFEFDAVVTASNTAKGGHREKRKEIVWRKLSTFAQENEDQLKLF